jgi:uncharacterized protein (TIGR02246 family)
MNVLQLFGPLFALLVATVFAPSSIESGDRFCNSALESLVHQQEAAWNRGDAPAWSASFSEEADFVNIRGELYHGRAAITQLHARIFAAPFKGSHTTMHIRLLSKLALGVALIETENEVVNFTILPPGIVPTSSGVLKTRMKYIAVQRGDAWQIISGQNTAILPTRSPSLSSELKPK